MSLKTSQPLAKIVPIFTLAHLVVLEDSKSTSTDTLKHTHTHTQTQTHTHTRKDRLPLHGIGLELLHGRPLKEKTDENVSMIISVG